MIRSLWHLLKALDLPSGKGILTALRAQLTVIMVDTKHHALLGDLVEGSVTLVFKRCLLLLLSAVNCFF